MDAFGKSISSWKFGILIFRDESYRKEDDELSSRITSRFIMNVTQINAKNMRYTPNVSYAFDVDIIKSNYKYVCFEGGKDGSCLFGVGQ